MWAQIKLPWQDLCNYKVAVLCVEDNIAFNRKECGKPIAAAGSIIVYCWNSDRFVHVMHSDHLCFPSNEFPSLTVGSQPCHMPMTAWFYPVSPTECNKLDTIPATNWKLFHHTTRNAWVDRRYGCYSFSTSALEGSGWSASRPGCALPPVPIVQEAGRAPEPVWTQRLEEKFFRLCRGSNLDRLVVQPVARHSIDWATRLKPATTTLNKIRFNELSVIIVFLLDVVEICFSWYYFIRWNKTFWK
jgi:hypothetical protein